MNANAIRFAMHTTKLLEKLKMRFRGPFQMALAAGRIVQNTNAPISVIPTALIKQIN